MVNLFFTLFKIIDVTNILKIGSLYHFNLYKIQYLISSTIYNDIQENVRFDNMFQSYANFAYFSPALESCYFL